MKLELRGITKTFGAFVANDAIDLVVEPGEIHSLLGENGAGKSTLMNVLYGLYRPDGGEIVLDDVPVSFSDPGDAMAAGIGMVHQHFMLVPVFTVAENVVLGHEPTKGGLLDLAAARKLVREISARFGFELDPDALVENLPVGAQQRVEIIKALSRRAEVLVLDEPTAVLTPHETDELMTIMRQLRDEGTSIVFITHKLREVKAVSDRITVIRRGRVVGEADPSADQAELASLMVGRQVSLAQDKAPAAPGDIALEVSDLQVTDEAGMRTLDGVSFEVHHGEVLAIAGVQGNGQTELSEALLGLQETVHGSALLEGRELVGRSTKQILDAGIGFVPEDRTHDALVADFSVAENLVLDQHDRAPFGSALAMSRRAVQQNADTLIPEFDVRTGSSAAAVSTLSGGNQQKVVMARALNRELALLIASQPTRGVDVGSIEFLHRRILDERDKGTPVIIVSTELDEVTQLADRIAVMYRGQILGIVPGDEDRDVLGLMMAGYTAEAAREAVASGARTTDSQLADEGEIV
ncbi:ABC transporter ATP-binding protein [Brachybacterium sp. JB7]|uniref:Heme ABC transporter ATP-binding protein n=1 Tax=Brachybacterium alimentarium TaxID=47845 RepID=A0A2A3YIQ2_9MICO|nr:MULTISPECIES: ABC transporter ATP-binding protein [Brachybacterium]PCC35635.1 heme ABC transporter ATP-binding protein [Brachybacterium alimentarium]PCC39161.1 heme ABC transporter ATP-binding protein [Brachybacterium alimentarium]RCS64703.1 ABC transporter ATP-binding protein [Brachybacterium sp. JB7]RCS66582.1 ABC transporter ATP-binding protein [Brachybacterium alimentarium]